DAGAELIWHRRVNDDRSATATALTEAMTSGADVILVSGGASVGDHDHTGALFASLGFTLHCEKVASRPGKPFIAASRGRQLAFGLPGNPLSHFVCFHLFVKRALDRLAGIAPTACVRAQLAPNAQLKADPRETWWPCVWADDGAQRRALPLPWRDSSDLTVLGAAEGLLRVPSTISLGAEIDILPCR
ncbi:MAG: molybdopterin-binding protein, partial [Rariglobus sp.]